MAIGRERRAIRRQELVMVTSHGGNSAAIAGRAGFARTGFVVTTSWSLAPGWIVLGGRAAPRHPWRRGRKPRSCWRDIRTVRKEASADFRPSSIDIEKSIAGCPRSGPRHSHGRRRFARQRRGGNATGLPRTRASCSTGARAFCELLAGVDKFDVKRLAASQSLFK